jgi:hypothetical protein
VVQLGGHDLLADVVGDEPLHQGAALEGDVGVAEDRVDQAGLTIALGAELAREGVAGVAADALATRRS